MAAQPATKKHKKVAKPVAKPVTQQDVQALIDSVATQQLQIETLKQELQKRDQAWQDTQQKLQAAKSEADEAKVRPPLSKLPMFSSSSSRWTSCRIRWVMFKPL